MGKKILVVDDSSTIRDQVVAALGGAGFEMLEAVDGIDGLQKLSDHQDLSLVVADINMPRMDGIEMLTRVAANSGHSGLKVLMLTTDGDREMIQKAGAVGANGWIVKPFQPEKLVRAVRRLTGS